MFALLAALAAQTAAPAAKTWPTLEADVILRNFRFADGESLPELRIHYTTLGHPHRNSAGEIDNAVMVLHGTGGDGHQFLRPQFADELYGPGQPLDIRKYWIILPDNIGHGKSSKPSDGLRMRFPKYDYSDMIEAQHRMLMEGLQIRHMRLIMGTSMGCMHSFMWGEMYPHFASALMPLACEPIEIAGLNRMWRQMVIDGIEKDPAWDSGNYSSEPAAGLRTAESILFIAGAAPLNLAANYPTREAAKAYVEQRVESGMADLDANDAIYQFDSSRTYNPWPRLETISAPLTWVNSADDFINPRNLGIPAKALKRMKSARFRLIAETSETHGHGTHTWAAFWKNDLIELLARSAK
ncbi:MAG TPA: alpha/beta fold hydrolase [Sphingomicrobium sp.]|jgi:homoserine O-acetyltransferase|nr:alpha/beta fold hydrolase [Sphingomicrobium sp.]